MFPVSLDFFLDFSGLPAVELQKLLQSLSVTLFMCICVSVGLYVGRHVECGRGTGAFSWNYIAVSCTIYELRSSDCQNTECFGKIENIETRMLTLVMSINIY